MAQGRVHGESAAWRVVSDRELRLAPAGEHYAERERDPDQAARRAAAVRLGGSSLRGRAAPRPHARDRHHEPRFSRRRPHPAAGESRALDGGLRGRAARDERRGRSRDRGCEARERAEQRPRGASRAPPHRSGGDAGRLGPSGTRGRGHRVTHRRGRDVDHARRGQPPSRPGLGRDRGAAWP